LKLKYLSPIFLALCLFNVSAFSQSNTETLIKNLEELVREDKFPEAIAEITKGIKTHPDNAALFKRRAELYYDSGNREAMIPDLLRSVELAPDDREIVLYAVGHLHAYEHYAESLDILNSYIERNEPDAAIFYNRSVSKTGLQDLLGAYEDLSTAIDLSPKHNAYRTEQIAILLKLSGSDDALDKSAKLIRTLEQRLAKAKTRDNLESVKDDLSWTYHMRARIFHSNGDTQAEFADLGKFIQYRPNFYNYQVRAQLYVDHQMYAEAIADLTDAIRVSDHPPIDSLIRRAEVYVLAEKYSEAVKDYEEALRTDGLANRTSVEQRLSEIRQKIKEAGSSPNI